MTERLQWQQRTEQISLGIKSQIKRTCKRILQDELPAADSVQLAELILSNLLAPSEEMSIIMLTKLPDDAWKKQLSQKLIEVFGKDTFAESEITKEFWEDLRIKCGDYFKTEDGAFDANLFWSENFKEWLLAEKQFSTAGIT